MMSKKITKRMVDQKGSHRIGIGIGNGFDKIGIPKLNQGRILGGQRLNPSERMSPPPLYLLLKCIPISLIKPSNKWASRTTFSSKNSFFTSPEILSLTHIIKINILDN